MSEYADIFICTHKDLKVYPKSDLYTLVPTEQELKEEYKIPVLKPCELNKFGRLINEVTCMYNVWKNCQLKKYVGFTHYRRFLYFQKYPDLDKIFEEYDVILPTLPKFDINSQKSVYKDYCLWHCKDDIDLMIKILRDLYPNIDLSHFFHNRQYYQYNIFITKSQIFYKLCEFIFPVIEEFIKRRQWNGMNDVRQFVKNNYQQYHLKDNEMIDYQIRIIGFLSERLTSLFWTTSNYKIMNEPVKFLFC